VADEPEITLLEAMRLAAGRDRIAWNYANGLGRHPRGRLPRFAALSRTGWAEPWASPGLPRLPGPHP
jgi:hypothetical protein